MKSTVSVLIAAYNAERTLGAAVHSVLSQQHCGVEIIITDDCSSDATFDVARALARQDARITVLQTPRNAGPSAARNLALSQATGEWVTILDADDRFFGHRLTTLLHCAHTNKLDVVADSYYVAPSQHHAPCASKMTTLCPYNQVRVFNTASFIRAGLGSLKPLIRRQVLLRNQLAFDDSVWAAEDLLLYTSLLLHGARFGLLNRPMYVRTDDPGSLSRANKVAFLNSVLQTLEQLSELAHKHGHHEDNVIQALQARKTITQDAIAAATWRGWFRGSCSRPLPPLASLFPMLRHLCLRKFRYNMAAAETVT